jgi:hypothetical protein
MAAFGWHGPDRAILEAVCRMVGLNLVGDNLREHVAIPPNDRANRPEATPRPTVRVERDVSQ